MSVLFDLVDHVPIKSGGHVPCGAADATGGTLDSAVASVKSGHTAAKL